MFTKLPKAFTSSHPPHPHLPRLHRRPATGPARWASRRRLGKWSHPNIGGLIMYPKQCKITKMYLKKLAFGFINTWFPNVHWQGALVLFKNWSLYVWWNVLERFPECNSDFQVFWLIFIHPSSLEWVWLQNKSTLKFQSTNDFRHLSTFHLLWGHPHKAESTTTPWGGETWNIKGAKHSQTLPGTCWNEIQLLKVPTCKERWSSHQAFNLFMSTQNMCYVMWI